MMNQTFGSKSMKFDSVRLLLLLSSNFILLKEKEYLDKGINPIENNEQIKKITNVEMENELKNNTSSKNVNNIWLKKKIKKVNNLN